MKYFLAVDIGASSGRHILCHIEGGPLVTEEIHCFPNSAVRNKKACCAGKPTDFFLKLSLE